MTCGSTATAAPAAVRTTWVIAAAGSSVFPSSDRTAPPSYRRRMRAFVGSGCWPPSSNTSGSRGSDVVTQLQAAAGRADSSAERIRAAADARRRGISIAIFPFSCPRW